jgi:hypothetical protein
MNGTLRKRTIQIYAAFTILVITVFGYSKVLARVGMPGIKPARGASVPQKAAI